MKRKPTQQANSKKGGIETKEDDDEIQDMPPLEDMRNVQSRTKTGGGKQEQTSEKASKVQKEKEKEVDLPKVEWQQGQACEWLEFVEDGLLGAYKYLGIDPAASLEKVWKELSAKMKAVDSADANESSTRKKAGAILNIACSKSDSANSEFKAVALRLYLKEANVLLRRLHLPLPRGTKIGDPLLPSTLSTTSPSVSNSSPSLSTPSLSAGDQASKRLEKAEQEGKRLRGENDQLRTSIASFKADVKEAFEARDQKEKENARLQSELAGLKAEKTEEITKLEGENVRLRALNDNGKPSKTSPDKTTFVIGALSKQVKDLSQQLKEKNDQLAELMIEMTKSTYEQ